MARTLGTLTLPYTQREEWDAAALNANFRALNTALSKYLTLAPLVLGTNTAQATTSSLSYVVLASTAFASTLVGDQTQVHIDAQGFVTGNNGVKTAMLSLSFDGGSTYTDLLGTASAAGVTAGGWVLHAILMSLSSQVRFSGWVYDVTGGFVGSSGTAVIAQSAQTTGSGANTGTSLVVAARGKVANAGDAVLLETFSATLMPQNAI